MTKTSRTTSASRSSNSRTAVRKSARPVTKRPAARTPTKSSSAKKTAAAPARKMRQGFISHTELASTNPAATKAWCQDVLGWKFSPPMPMPSGDYHMWSFGDNVGGGIRSNNPPEHAGSVPYAEVRDIKAAYAKAVRAGATPMMPPDEIPGGGWIAIVMAPGGVQFGFYGTK